MTDTSKPTVHILGGGPSGLSAAFHLTSPIYNPGWADRYDVVIHQMGWRLGGKGATGRNADAANRIEEHGIHLFGNFYTNSLHMMWQALQERAEAEGTPVPSMLEEFPTSNHQMATDFYDGGWHGFSSGLPHDDQEPWKLGDETIPIEEILDPWHHPHAIADLGKLSKAILRAVRAMLQTRELPAPGSPTVEQYVRRHGEQHHRDELQTIVDDLHVGMRTAVHAIFGHHDLADLLDRALAAVRSVVDDVERAPDVLRFIEIELDLLSATIRGVVADNLVDNGIDHIDGLLYHDWLAKHGASKRSLQSSLPQVIPNVCMQYRGGDSTVLPAMSAAAYVTFVLRQLVAPGPAAFFFKVSTGETVILPLYDVLKERGVEFRFFSKVRSLVASSDGERIEAIRIERQATPTGDDGYDPIVTLPDGQRVWPNQPRWDKLVEGDRLRAEGVDVESWWADWEGPIETLTVGEHDQVVVALPPAVQQLVCADAAAAKPKWKDLVDRVETAATAAVQIWLDRSTEEMGWPSFPGTDRATFPTYTGPISGAADFTQALPFETWPDDKRPKGLIYFCGALQDPIDIPDFSDHDYPARAKARVEAMTAQYLRQLAGLLPGSGDGAMNPNSLDFAKLHAYDERTAGTGEQRVAQQYCRANIDPNERYTLSTPGSLQYRPHPWESGYTNCALSSDAVFTGFNIGSFEGSVMSGMLASLAVVGSPTLDQIYGYDFLRPNPKGPDKPLMPK